MAGNNTNYAYIHDTLLRKYRRNSLYIIWAVILNFIGVLLAVLDYINNIENSFGYGALYNFVGVILKLITNKTYLNPWLFFLYALLLSIPFSVPSLIFGFKGYRGDKKSLYLSIAIYSVDTVLCIPAFLLYNWMDCVLSIIVHAVFLGVMFLALMKRKELIELRNKHMEKVKVDPNLAPKETTVVSFNEFKRNVKNKKTVGEKMEQNKTNTQNKVE